MFTLELLQAINDWQIGGTIEAKESLAENIKKYAIHLPSKFKTLSNVCYRKINLEGKYILEIGLCGEILEKYSSWTLRSSIVQNFDGGIPEHQSCKIPYIFELNPSNSEDFEVIINLYELFNDLDFKTACVENQKFIKDFHLGIGEFKNSEAEVILKVSKLGRDQIWALGGHGIKTKEEFYKLINEVFEFINGKPLELKEFDEMISQNNIPIGGSMWITKESNPKKVESLIQKNKEYAFNLMQNKK